jgi:UDP-2,4-diacetamido-2,4,6-trideoxy-beta-L-altropyranose hydrolase
MTSLCFVTEAGPAVGLGHLRRCLSLAEALRDAGIDCRFAVTGGDVAESLIVASGFEHMPLAAIDAAEVARVTRDCDGAVVDSYRMTADVLSAAKSQVIAIDDLADRALPAQLVINSAIGADSLDYRRLTDALLLLGPSFALLRRAFADDFARVTQPAIGRILVTLGGGNQADTIRDVVRWCVSAARDAEIEVVAGPFADSSELRDLAPRASLLRQPDMRAAMLRADLAVSAGGQTLFELAATGLPAIVLATAANQAANIAGFATAGTIRSVSDASTFAAAFGEMANPAARAEMSRRGRAIVDGRGAQRAAGAIAALLRGGRSEHE